MGLLGVPAGTAAGGGVRDRAPCLRAGRRGDRERRIGLAAVGAADSWLFRPWLEAADSDWRLLCGRNPDGFQPGEAAAFFLLEPAAESARRSSAPLASVAGFAAGQVGAAKGLPNTGAELAATVDALLPAGAPPLIVCDLN